MFIYYKRVRLGALPKLALSTAKSVFGDPKALSPVSVQIEPTNYCNQKCVFCYRQNNPWRFDNKHMTFAEFKKIIDSMPDLEELLLNGYGEPLLCPDIFKMLEYASSKGIFTKTNTNMSLLTKENAKKLVETGINEVFISLDSVDPKLYEKLRGTKLELTLKGFENLLEARKKAKSNMKITLNFVVTEETIPGMKNIIDYITGKDVLVKFKSLTVTGKNAAKMMHKSVLAINEMKKYAKNKGVNVWFKMKDKSENKPFCYAIWFGSFIDVNGNMAPCCQMPYEYSFGNVLDTSLEECWNSEKFIEFRKALNSRDLSKLPKEIQNRCYNCNFCFNDQIHKLRKIVNNRP
ncbi:MAG: radical SAM protein [archaeon]|jgi:radical SAM protein with 4Fe4S-binding SPASM domain